MSVMGVFSSDCALMQKRCWVEVDLTQLRENYLSCVKMLPESVRVMAVVKADAYGHGDVRLAKELSNCGVRSFAVSNLDEAVCLRKAGVVGDILILGYVDAAFSRTLLEFDLTQAIVSEEHAEALAQSGLPVKCQFAIDTGMNRVGLDGNNVDECAHVIRTFRERLRINGIFTHLCVADADNVESVKFTVEQMSRFLSVSERVKDLRLEYVHCCNSAAGLTYLKKFPQFAFVGGIVRLGIVLYGLKPCEGFPLSSAISPILTWKAVITRVKRVGIGETVGYGRIYEVRVPTVIATVAAGYADGVDRRLSNRGFVLVNGRKAPIVGRVCMDQLMVDVTGVANVHMGTEVVLLGRSGSLSYSADEMAKDLGTIGYEIVCGISKRVKRYYIT